KNPLLGYDVAGRVETVGGHVTLFRPGDEVFGTCRGSFAEYAAARPERLASKPDNISFEQAAAVPISGYAALQAVRDHGRVRVGQRVLIIGAGGGVGTFAVQLAKAYGAEVTGVCSTSKVDLVRSLGADHVIDYTREEIGDGRNRYDVIVDIAGNRPLSQLRRALTPRGTLVIVGGEDSGKWLGVRRQLRASALSPFVRQKLGTFISKERRQDLEELQVRQLRSESGDEITDLNAEVDYRRAHDASSRCPARDEASRPEGGTRPGAPSTAARAPECGAWVGSDAYLGSSRLWEDDVAD